MEAGAGFELGEDLSNRQFNFTGMKCMVTGGAGFV
jgi:hypothetical protein